jgi:hypothetical protein
MNSIASKSGADRLLSALSEQLQALGHRYELVVVGGSALVGLDLVSRATKDVDVVALRQDGGVETANPLPGPIVEARRRVARDFALPEEWLNEGPASLLDFGLPEGFDSRAARRDYGPALTVWLASRFDQIHFKLFATVDQGPGRHEADLRALDPTDDELLTAARWTRTHDPSPGYRAVLVEVLRAFGVEDAAERA